MILPMIFKTINEFFIKQLLQQLDDLQFIYFEKRKKKISNCLSKF